MLLETSPTKTNGFIPTGFVPFETVFAEAKKGTDSLILLSGGLDSAYVFWQYSRIVTDRPIYAHHVKLLPSLRKRHEVEEHFVKEQVKYSQRDVELFISSIDIDPRFNSGIMRDFFMPVLMSVQMAVKYNLKYIVIGEDLMVAFLRNTGLEKRSDFFEEEQVEALSEMVRTLSFGKVKLSWHTANKEYFKSYLSLPEDYMKLCFSCRNPVFTETHIEICRECLSCNRNLLLEIKNLVCERIERPKDD